MMAITSFTATNILVIASALILSPLLVLGNHSADDYPKLLSNFCNDETLILENFAGITLSKNSITSSSLKCISIIKSSLTSMEEGIFDKVPNLMYLNLQGNSMSASNFFSFVNVSTLRALILSDQLTSYPEQLTVNTMYPELRYLNLRNNRISDIIIKTIEPFPNLTHLDLSGNQFSEYSFGSSWTDTLTHLNLNDNRISRISFVKSKNLVSLILDNNDIENIGGSYNSVLDLEGLNKLEYLSIANNLVKYISTTAFNDTINLRYLNISGNALSILNTNIFLPLSSLEVLILDDNTFDTIPVNIPMNMTTLSLKCNNIAVLTGNSLFLLPYLRKLILSGNMISTVYPETFRSQRLLEELYLNDNKLTYLPVRWDFKMKNLRLLDLSGNQFTSITMAIGSISEPSKRIHLDDNPIEYVDSSVLPKNVTIYLNIGKVRSKNYCKRDHDRIKNDYYYY